ncbi:MAG: hypothetical protein Q8O53_00205 [Candidatus Moranbacteria bacterium]|nr:hypothetical protein [Candidatus Moranbacteria bacterium]
MAGDYSQMMRGIRKQAKKVKSSGEKPSKVLYLGLGFIALFKDLLDFTGVGSLPGIGTVVTLCVSFLIWILLTIFDRSGVKTNTKITRSLLILILGLVEAIGFGLNFLLIETFTVILLYVMAQKAWKKEEKKSQGEKAAQTNAEMIREYQMTRAMAATEAARVEEEAQAMEVQSQVQPGEQNSATPAPVPAAPRMMSDMKLPSNAVVPQGGTEFIVAPALPRTFDREQISPAQPLSGSASTISPPTLIHSSQTQTSNGLTPPPLPDWARNAPPLPKNMIPPPPAWSPDSGTPPPMTPEYGVNEPTWSGKERGLPPPLPRDAFSQVPPPLPLQPPPLPGRASDMMTPPPLPGGFQPSSLSEKYGGISEMKERVATDTDERSVEQVIRRNNVFIVHTFAESDVQHHNSNSNVSEKATYGDDMDIMLAFEPSVSASSITPGKKSRLWSPSGFILAGGQIGEVGGSDIGSGANGIKSRGGANSSIEQIDDFIGRRGKKDDDIYKQHGSYGMNEAVVNNPEVFGFFQQAERDEDGRYWAYSLNTKKQAEDAKENPREWKAGIRKWEPSPYAQVFQNNVKNYGRRFATAQERGIPLYIMTPDREVYECLGVNDDGTVEVGKPLTPEEVAKGRAGLSIEKRVEIGEKLLEKGIFRGEENQIEARQVIEDLRKQE